VVTSAHEVPVSGGHLDGRHVEGFLAGHPEVDAVGVRVVHGGAEFRDTVLVDQKVEDRLAEVADLAPLHDPPALEAVRLVRQACPELPVVACFDTAFFAGLPAAAATYAVPWTWIERWGLRRYGFHGLSHAYASRRAADMLGRPPADLRLVICHLGAGASLAAVGGGAPVDTTMGFTPLDGLVMATRPGAVDPGLVVWVQQHGGLSVDEVGRALLFEAGLAGLSGTSGDMRDVIKAADGGDERAGLALAVYLHRLRGAIAAMVASLGGLDAVVFTGGVGEHSARIRADACAGLGFLGLRADPDHNGAVGGGDRDVATTESPVRILVVHAREEQEIAREVRRIVGGDVRG
jgi:acetate kinase